MPKQIPLQNELEAKYLQALRDNKLRIERKRAGLKFCSKLGWGSRHSNLLQLGSRPSQQRLVLVVDIWDFAARGFAGRGSYQGLQQYLISSKGLLRICGDCGCSSSRCSRSSRVSSSRGRRCRRWCCLFEPS
jgi:hypothetical protein